MGIQLSLTADAPLESSPSMLPLNFNKNTIKMSKNLYNQANMVALSYTLQQVESASVCGLSVCNFLKCSLTKAKMKT